MQRAKKNVFKNKRVILLCMGVNRVNLLCQINYEFTAFFLPISDQPCVPIEKEIGNIAINVGR